MDQFEPVIGLEVHVQLATDSKIFATSSTTAGREPNTLTDPVTLGLPGCLPVLNKRAVDFAIRVGLATNCEVHRESTFARKHYFYPDLPKGYQISQYDQPVCTKGSLDIRIDGDIRPIAITRIHLEEDAGKSVHRDDEPSSIVDLNRAGVALVEIVSEPEIRNPQEAGAYMRHLRQIVRYLEISDGNMEEGSLRCDANVSLRKVGTIPLGKKVEIKNLNSFRFVERALEYEISRQRMLLEHGGEVVQETRLWDEQKGVTRSMRSKEYAEDYRYFPDPDLPPLIIDTNWIEKIRANLPELPASAYARFKKLYNLPDYYCELLTEEKFVARYYDQAVSFHNNPQAVANWITTELFGRLNKEGVTMEDCPISPEQLANLVKLIDEETISGKIAKTVFEEMFATGQSPDSIVEAQGLTVVSDKNELLEMVNRVIAEYPAQVAEYRSGKTKMFGFFVGQLMKLSDGKGNPRILNQLLKEKLEEK